MKDKIFSLIIFLIFISISTACYTDLKANNTNADSLRKEIINQKGKNRISAQIELGLLIFENDTLEAKSLAFTALKSSKKEKDLNLEIQAYYLIGRINQHIGNDAISETYYDSALYITEIAGNNMYKGEILFRKGVLEFNNSKELKALEYFNSSLQASRITNNYKTMGSAYSVMGTIFRLNGLYDRAIEYTVNSKLYYEKANFDEGDAWAAYLLGRIYSDVKLPIRAMEYFKKALDIYIRLESIDGNGTGTAICLEQIGLVNLELGNFEKAREYIDETLLRYKKVNSKYGISNSYKNQAIIDYKSGNYDSAEKLLTEALKTKIEINDKLSLPTIYQYLGLCYIGKGYIDKGLSNLNNGLDIALLNNQKKIQLNIYSKLTDVYFKLNDLKNAIKCQQAQINIQDTLLTGTANIKMEQLQAIYEIDMQNEQIVELEKQNEINSLTIRQNQILQIFMISGILIIALISIMTFWFYKKIRTKNKELSELNASKDRFFAIIAHDLRGPTNNLSIFLEYLKDTYNEHSQEELKEIILSLSESAKNVSSLLENLLKWAQSQRNQIEFKPIKLNLNEVVQTAIKGLKLSADSKEIEIGYDMQEVIHVNADPDMIQTIIRNILSNSIKFTNRGGNILIKTRFFDKSNAEISISDNGIGIDKKNLDKIFELSNNLHTKGTEDENSTGLGLILVREFVNKNNGTVKIESEKGKGTTVTFTLPLS